jgi:protein-tyrosine-phosphatase
VLPSIREGIPLALLEAMALAKPAVATRVGGIPEIINDRETGLLVPPRDAGALATACLDLARDRDLAHRLGARARQVVEAEFSSEKSGSALLGLYREVVFPAGARRTTATSSTWRLARGCLDRAREQWRCAIERERIHRSRGNPAALTFALRSARSILMVCHGNIIRSPFAARLVTRALGDGRRVRIASCGLAAVPGSPPHAAAVLAATARHVDLRGHVAAPLTRECVAGSDVIFVMDVRQLLEMRRRFPEARSRTFLLTGLARGVPLEIRDPVFGDESVFHACYDHICRAVDPILRVLSPSTITS